MNDLGLPSVGNIVAVFFIALSVASVSYTIAKTKVAAPFREWINSKSTWLGNLFGCPYCVSHWLVFFAIAIYRPRIVEYFWPTDFLITAFTAITINALFIGGIKRAMAPGSIAVPPAAKKAVPPPRRGLSDTPLSPVAQVMSEGKIES